MTNIIEGFEVLRLFFMQSSFRFTTIERITIPAAGFLDDLRFHSISSGHNIKWDHVEILASDLQCKIKETLLMRDLKPALNKNVGSEKLFLY